MEQNIKFWQAYQSAYNGDEVYGYEWGGEEILETISMMCKPYIKGKRVLEIGCGGGKWTKALFDRMGAKEVTTFDVHPVATAKTKEYEPRANVWLCEGDEFPDSTDPSIEWDIVFTFDVFLHLPQPLVFRYLQLAMEAGTPIIFGLPILDLPGCRELMQRQVSEQRWVDPYTRGYIEIYCFDFVISMSTMVGGIVRTLGMSGNRDMMFILKPNHE